MDETPRPDMLAATRFVQAGRLTEATALLQRLLRGELEPEITAAPTPDAPAGRTPRTIDLAAETVEVTDHPPTSRTGQAFGTGAASWPLGGGTAGVAQPHLPEALRGFLERLDGGFGPGLDGLAKPFPPRAPDPVMPDGAKFLAGTYADQAGSRDYRLYVPSGYHGEPVPLVVMLHGCTQSPEDFAAGTRMNALAEEQGCLVALPGPGAGRQRAAVLELVQPGRPAARPGRAGADRRHHPPGHARARGRPAAGLRRRALRRRGRGRDHGGDLPRPLRRRRRAFRPRPRVPRATCPPPSPPCGRARPRR